MEVWIEAAADYLKAFLAIAAVVAFAVWAEGTGDRGDDAE